MECREYGWTLLGGREARAIGARASLSREPVAGQWHAQLRQDVTADHEHEADRCFPGRGRARSVAAILGPGVKRRASRSRAARSLPQPLPGSQEQCCTASGVGGLPAAWREAGCLVALHERRPGLMTPELRPSHEGEQG